MIINLYRHRWFILRTAWSQVRNQYAGSSLGGLWNVLQPLALIIVFAIVFSSLIDRGDRDVPGGFVVYLCSAMLPWLAFAECMNRGSNSFISSAKFLRKMPIAEQVFMAQSCMSTTIGLAISYGLFLAVAPLLGQPVTWHWLLIPIPLAMLMGLGFGVALFLGTLRPFIRDIGQILPVIIRVGFWAYPVVYVEEMLPHWARAALPYNPVYPALQALRTIVAYNELPAPWVWPVMAGWALGACVVGYLVLRALRRELRDVL